MKIFNNVTDIVRDDLQVTITKGSRISIAAACFSMYAYQELKKQMDSVEQFRFIFTSPTFVQEREKKERREFYIPRLSRETSLYGTEFEIKLRNEMTQRAIAKECADWIARKATFKSNTTGENMGGFMTVTGAGEDTAYMPMNGFTTVDIGCERGNNSYNMVNKMDAPFALQYLQLFDSIWNDKEKLQDVTSEVVENIRNVYNENAPEYIYYMTLYHVFSEFLEDVSEDVLPNEATGFKQSKIWSMLYDFQKDAVLAIINKLEKYNGCILADSVGLGKTFTALAVAKYYENRNKTVLVLCPKKLAENWNTYKDNYVNNPIAADRLNYDVLFHTDLSRNGGYSNGLDLERLNWGNYDLVIIDESHNFRNGGEVSGEAGKENRYLRLLNKVVRAGVKTKVLMLSATPVNNRFNDLKNQLALAYEGNSELINCKLNTRSSIDEIFRQAQKAFNAWSEKAPENRTTDALLRTLDFDFFEVLDIVGSRFEWDNIKTKEFRFFDPRCFFTDDSVMTLAVAKTVLDCSGDWGRLSDQTVKCMQEVGRPYPDCGYGGRFYGWMYSDDPKPYGSYGNGAGMRVSAVAWAAGSLEECIAMSEAVTKVTHNHPEGIKGAEAIAVATYLALHGASKDEIRDYVESHYYPLDFTLDEIRDTYRFNETCQETIPQAIEAFLESTDFEDAIRNAISIGGDSDTLAACTGAIAEAFYGIPAGKREVAKDYLDLPLLTILESFEQAFPPKISK